MAAPSDDFTAPERSAAASERELVFERAFDSPRALVFAAWTQPEHITHWWDPSGIPLAACEIDLRPGGTFRFAHAPPVGAGEGDPRASGHVFAGTYREIDPPDRLVFTTRGPSGADSVGTLVFAEQDGRTELTMRITCATVADREMMKRFGVDTGTERTLDNLGAYLAGIRT